MAILLLAGGIVMQFLVVLSGAHIGSPINQVFFLQADTSGISNGNSNYQNPARWTYFSVCGVQNGLNANCGHTTAALPFAPAQNFGTTTGLPSQFVGSSKYYYLSRVAWAFYIIALFFAVVAFFLSIFALCARLGAYLTGLTTGLAVLFQAVCAALMTYVCSSQPISPYDVLTLYQCLDNSSSQRLPRQQSLSFNRCQGLRLHLGHFCRMAHCCRAVLRWWQCWKEREPTKDFVLWSQAEYQEQRKLYRYREPEESQGRVRLNVEPVQESRRRV